MRPVPRSRHLVAVMIFAAVGAAAGYFASVETRMSPAQVNIASAAVRRQQPGAFEHDPIFGERPLWRFHTPALQGLLELILVPTDYQDLRLPFRALAGIVTLVYLCGMYALLYAHCRSWSVSAFVAVLSSRVVEGPGGSFWGVGSLESIAPPAMVLAVLPLIVLAMLRYSRRQPGQPFSSQWRLLLLFGAVGLLGNLHLVTAMNITIVLLIAYVARQRFSPACLPMAAGCALSALLGALPYAWYYFGLRAAMGRWDPAPGAEVIFEAFRIADLAVLYPDLLKYLLDWRLLAGALTLVVPAVALVARIERYRGQDVGFWVAMALGSLATGFGLHGLSQVVGTGLGAAPPVIDFVQASCLVMLPMYVLLAQALTNLFRLLRGHRALARWLCTILLAAWLIPSDNFRIARHGIAELAVGLMPGAESDSLLQEYVPDLRQYVQRHRDQRRRRKELEQIGRWASERPASVYITDRAEFRVLARRPIVAAAEDARYLYYLAPGRLGQWLRRYRAQQHLLDPPTRTDAPAVRQFVADLVGQEPSLQGVKEWYAIIPASAAPEKPDPLVPVGPPTPGAWGEDYRLYRVDLAR